MTLFFYVVGLSLLGAASLVGLGAPARELPSAGVRNLAMWVMNLGALGFLVWIGYGLYSLAWWEALLGLVIAGVFMRGLTWFIGDSGFIVVWGMVLSLGGIALMSWEFFG